MLEPMVKSLFYEGLHMTTLLRRILGPRAEVAQTMPKSLYRYQRFTEWLRPVIVESTLYFPLMGELNDPCELCYRIDLAWNEALARRQIEWIRANKHPNDAVKAANPNIDVETVENAIRSMPIDSVMAQMRNGYLSQSDAQREEMIRAQLRIDAATVGVSCFTTLGESGYMAHFYAADHSGVCLEFSTAHPPFSLAEPVKYLEEPGVVRLIFDPGRAVPERMQVKGVDWRQENEWRVVNHRVNHGSLVAFPPEALLSIALGAKFDPLNLMLLRDWIAARGRSGHPVPTLYQFARRQSSFKMDRIKLDLH